MKIRHRGRDDKIELQMTPMIDIVFQLNIFFLFTFKIVLPEGDFNVQMPSAAALAGRRAERVAAAAIGDAGRRRPGELADLQLAGRSFGNGRDAFAQLQNYIRTQVVAAGGGIAEEQEVEIDADYNLNYDYVVRAITAVTGYIENGQPHKLIERIKFTPPKK